MNEKPNSPVYVGLDRVGDSLLKLPFVQGTPTRLSGGAHYLARWKRHQRLCFVYGTDRGRSLTK